MVSTIDGMTEPRRFDVGATDEYEKTGSELAGDAWLCGRVTMAKDFAKFHGVWGVEPQEKAQFTAKSATKTGARAAHKASADADSFAICADTRGTLAWNTNDIYGDHLICLVSEEASAEYLAHLEAKSISYVVAGKDRIDFPRALEELHAVFGIETLLLEGGGIVNGGLLDADLVDEVSLLVIPGIDGRAGVSAVFEGRADDAKPVALTLKSADKRANGILWLRYDVSKR